MGFLLENYIFCGIFIEDGSVVKWYNFRLQNESSPFESERARMQNKINKTSGFFGRPAHSVNDLILFCIHSIISNSEQCSFERLVKECFTLFPDTLKFPRYPIWPDSRKLDRPLRALRNEKLIIGDPKTYFIMTKIGEEKASSVSKMLRQGKLL